MRARTADIMVLCDSEEEYAQLMTEFLRKQKGLPWEIHTYTDMEKLLQEEKEKISLLVVAESAVPKVAMQPMAAAQPKAVSQPKAAAQPAGDVSFLYQVLEVGRLVILSESGVMRWEGVTYVDKYQEAEEVLKYLLCVYMEVAEKQLPEIRKKGKTVFVGNYSPVRRCMQTSFALTMSLLLARSHRTLYLNFEHYAGIAELLPDMQTLDLADLLYFLGGEEEKFGLRLRTLVKHMGNLDYVPPMKSGQNLLTVTPGEWLGLLGKLEEVGEYEYVILDLCESMQGVFEILRRCRRVYTLVAEDKIAKSKLLQYEQVLALYEYTDVLEKTKRLEIPRIRRLPEELEQLTKSDLAGLVEKLIQELTDNDGDGNDESEDYWRSRNS